MISRADIYKAIDEEIECQRLRCGRCQPFGLAYYQAMVRGLAKLSTVLFNGLNGEPSPTVALHVMQAMAAITVAAIEQCDEPANDIMIVVVPEDSVSLSNDTKVMKNLE